MSDGNIIKLKMGELVDSDKCFSELIVQKFASGKTIKRLSKITRQVSQELEDFNKVREEIYSRNGELKEDGRYIFPTKEQQKLVFDGINELRDEEIIINGSQFSLYELRSIKDSFSESDEDAVPAYFTPEMMWRLEWLIKS